MTILTIGFNIGMTLDDVPGHDECFEVDRARHHCPATHG